MANTLYEQLKAKGHDMSWYEKSKGRTIKEDSVARLNNEYCGRLSIYLIDPAGIMHTTDSAGQPYMEVRRNIANKSKKPIYICLHCKQQWSDFDKASKHYGGSDEDNPEA